MADALAARARRRTLFLLLAITGIVGARIHVGLGLAGEALALVTIAALTAGCGGDTTPRGAASSEVARGDPSAAEARPTARARSEPVSPEDVGALVAAWRDAVWTDAEPAAAEALLSAGPPALERLLPLLADEDHYTYRLVDLIRRFGADAVGPLVGMLGSEDEHARAMALSLLTAMAPDWVYGEQGTSVCRALVARLSVEEDLDSAARALKASRPAGAVVAKDLAGMWRTADGARRRAIASVLEALGPDARAAAPTVRQALVAGEGATETPSADAGGSRRLEALRILAAMGAGDASLLAPIQRVLRDGTPEERLAALDYVRMLGAAGSPAAPQVAALLRDSDGDVWAHAGTTLAAIPSLDDATWRELVSAGCPDLGELAKDPVLAARLARTLPTLPSDAMSSAYDALAASDAFDMSSLTADLLRHPLPQARVLALRSWEYAEGDAPPPEGTLDLLADADPSVRAAAARVFAEREAAPDERLREVAMALRASPDAKVRAEAVSALGALSLRDPSVIDSILSALSDAEADVRWAAVDALSSSVANEPKSHAALLRALSDGDDYVRDAAVRQLAAHTAPDAPDRAPIVAALVASLREDMASWIWMRRVHVTVSWDWERRVDALLRLGGGADALARAVESVLAAGRGAEFDGALELAVRLAPHVASVRPALTRLRESADDFTRSAVDEAIAEVDFAAATDPDAIARGNGADTEKVRRLVPLGAPGMRALVLLASVTSKQDDLLGLLAGVPLQDAIEESANATGTDDDTTSRRVGAAVLAPLLPDAEAIAVLTQLAAYDEIRGAVVHSLCTVEERSRGSVPLELASRLLRDAEHRRVWTALPLVELLGVPAADLDPSFLPDLRALRGAGEHGVRARAAVALWRITRREDEALPTLRALLANPERIVGSMPWTAIGAALSEMRLAPEDVAAVVATVRRAASLCAPAEMDQEEGRGPGDAVEGALKALIPVLERCGAGAVAAVPALCPVVSRWGTSNDSPGGAAARALGAMGAGARAALADLRRAAVVHGDPDGVVRDAIRRIEAGAR